MLFDLLESLGDPVARFLSELSGNTEPHSADPEIRVLGPASVRVQRDHRPGAVRLTQLKTMRMGTGHANQLLRILCVAADKLGVPLHVDVSDSEPDGLPLEHKVQFYRHCGFGETGRGEGQVRLSRNAKSSVPDIEIGV